MEANQEGSVLGPSDHEEFDCQPCKLNATFQAGVAQWFIDEVPGPDYALTGPSKPRTCVCSYRSSPEDFRQRCPIWGIHVVFNVSMCWRISSISTPAATNWHEARPLTCFPTQSSSPSNPFYQTPECPLPPRVVVPPPCPTLDAGQHITPCYSSAALPQKPGTRSLCNLPP